MSTNEIRGLPARALLAQAHVQAVIYGEQSTQYRNLLAEAVKEAKALGFSDFDSYCHVEHPTLFNGERILIERWQLGWCESGSGVLRLANG